METQALVVLNLGVYNERDDRVPGGVAKEMLSFLEQRYPKASAYEKRALELGVGAGSIMSFLRDKFGEKVTGMDIREKLARDEKIRNHLLAGDILPMPINTNSVDVVVSMHMYAPNDLKNILREIERILIVGGETTLVIPRTGQKDERPKLPGETKLEIAEAKEISVPEEVGEAWIIILKKK